MVQVESYSGSGKRTNRQIPGAGLLEQAAQVPGLRTGLAEHVPWDRNFLLTRYRSYAAANDPRAPLAKTQLEEFLREQPVSLKESLLLK